MDLSIRNLLVSKGIQTPENHLEMLEIRWERLETFKKDLNHVKLDDQDIALRHIPGGDHVE
ncbi:hypothetical protein [Bacillus sp. J33]|uniref:hypothetical protein n=1 Tax=Bacillus sp. J33 TaxID=935836 RepID=UPI00047A523E|nr:hypothetical protein [Bacillus sp. J33]